MEIKKNDYLDIEIVDIGSNGEGVGKIDNFTIFVDNALPNEKVRVKIINLKKNYGNGKLTKILEPSPYREEAPCEYYQSCGGCNIMHLNYDEQLKIKAKHIQGNLKKIAKIEDIEVPKTLGMETPFHYRNKASFPVSFENTLNIGFFRPRSHNIVNIKKCIIQSDINDVIIAKMRDFVATSKISVYNEDTGKGDLKHIVTRVNKEGQVLVSIVINNTKFNYKKDLLDTFKDVKEIDSIVINFNIKKNNTILGDKLQTIYGKGYLVDTIKDLKFNISPLSFYQVNSKQVETLYEKTLEFCDLKGDEIVFDAYCGIGTISLFLAQKCKKVYGIEIIEQAVENAEENARINNIENTEFLVGKAEMVIPELITKEGITPDLVVVDPPRKGCEKELLEAIANTDVKKIVYVSCDNATLCRDISYLKEFGFKLEKIQPVDMFCMSMHVECVAVIKK